MSFTPKPKYSPPPPAQEVSDATRMFNPGVAKAVARQSVGVTRRREETPRIARAAADDTRVAQKGGPKLTSKASKALGEMAMRRKKS